MTDHFSIQSGVKAKIIRNSCEKRINSHQFMNWGTTYYCYQIRNIQASFRGKDHRSCYMTLLFSHVLYLCWHHNVITEMAQRISLALICGCIWQWTRPFSWHGRRQKRNSKASTFHSDKGFFQYNPSKANQVMDPKLWSLLPQLIRQASSISDFKPLNSSSSPWLLTPFEKLIWFAILL